jgi:Protein of unknown function (DUF2695)
MEAGSKPASLLIQWSKQMSLEVMTPESPRWEQFVNTLDSAMTGNYCAGDENENPAHAHRYAKAAMAAMGGIDIENSLAFFKEHGGYCDCEILLNVDPW